MWRVYVSGVLVRSFLDYLDFCDFICDGEYMYKNMNIVYEEV